MPYFNTWKFYKLLKKVHLPLEKKNGLIVLFNFLKLLIMMHYPDICFEVNLQRIELIIYIRQWLCKVWHPHAIVKKYLDLWPKPSSSPKQDITVLWSMKMVMLPNVPKKGFIIGQSYVFATAWTAKLHHSHRQKLDNMILKFVHVPTSRPLSVVQLMLKIRIESCPFVIQSHTLGWVFWLDLLMVLFQLISFLNRI